MDSLKEKALSYHQQKPAGKLEITPTKTCLTSQDLSLAYTPGVAEPCRVIEENPEASYLYTNKANLVGVISNGSAVLGLGNIGALAGKPVMEGKALLFKRFADVDAYDIEIDAKTVNEMFQIIKAMEPTFGGINLEDIKAPECFELEDRLQESMNIPIFHDDQHGTAIIAAAGIFNAIEIQKKDLKSVRIVFSGAGAAAIATAKLLIDMGVTHEQIILTDTKGVVYKGRLDGMNPHKAEFATAEETRSLKDALEGADLFIGCSAKDILSQEMVKSMNERPIIFAMANPDPEILPILAKEASPDAIIATGRSDFPNQVNNVLGFPFIFRGALDVQAKCINKEMKIAAVKALSDLAKQPVSKEVLEAYPGENFEFGPNYIIPKPFDSRVLTEVAPAVAKAAIDTGVARKSIENIDSYKKELEERIENLKAKL